MPRTNKKIDPTFVNTIMGTVRNRYWDVYGCERESGRDRRFFGPNSLTHLFRTNHRIGEYLSARLVVFFSSVLLCLHRFRKLEIMLSVSALLRGAPSRISHKKTSQRTVVVNACTNAHHGDCCPSKDHKNRHIAAQATSVTADVNNSVDVEVHGPVETFQWTKQWYPVRVEGKNYENECLELPKRGSAVLATRAPPPPPPPSTPFFPFPP